LTFYGLLAGSSAATAIAVQANQRQPRPAFPSCLLRQHGKIFVSFSFLFYCVLIHHADHCSSLFPALKLIYQNSNVATWFPRITIVVVVVIFAIKICKKDFAGSGIS
jgi:hypothetical protein